MSEQYPGQQPPFEHQPQHQAYTGYHNTAAPYANPMKNALGVAALIIGILTLLFSWFPFLGFGSYLTGAVGLALGLYGYRRVRHGVASNGGIAVAGATLSALGLASVILATVVYSAFFYAASQDTTAAGPEPNSVVATDEPTSDEPTTAASSEPTTAAPSPDGTFTGTCDYELGEFMADEYKLTGEVDVENTGNVGIVVKVKITWPQYGNDPVKETKKVRVGYGDTKTVRFNRDATSTEIDRLQTWQTNHGFKDGCKYDGKMLDTYGQVHS